MPSPRKTPPAWAHVLEHTAPFEHVGPFVYFIQAEGGGPVKIGTTHDLPSRLIVLQTSAPHRLAVRCVVLGGTKIERALHFMFREHRVSGEWFDNADEILAFAQGAREQCLGLSADERLAEAKERREAFHAELIDRYIDGEPLADIADELSCSVSMVTQQLAKLRKRGVQGIQLRQVRTVARDSMAGSVRCSRTSLASSQDWHRGSTADFADDVIERLSA